MAGMGMSVAGNLREAQHKRLEEHFEQQKRARQIAVPTNDNVVKQRLRELGEPICLFGELAEDRRKRLREVLARKAAAGEAIPSSSSASTTSSSSEVAGADGGLKAATEEKEIFYTEGTPELQQSRLRIAQYSLPRAKERLRIARGRKEKEDKEIEEGGGTFLVVTTEDKIAHRIHEHAKTFAVELSQIGDDRAISCCAISPDASIVATGSWTGLVKLWNVEKGETIRPLRGHTERLGAVAFHPDVPSMSSLLSSANNAQDGVDDKMEIESGASSTVALASCAADNKVLLWSLTKSEPIAKLEGHFERVNRVAFHPSGAYLASTSFDLTWRLWDVETRKELLEQEGHSRPVYALGFHPDGSLLATAGLDALGRVWDLRTGRSIYIMKGHVKHILSLDFSPNGYHIATGSDDNTVKIWDLRKRKAVYTIPAHLNLVSAVKYHPTNGSYLITSSFDKSCKIWSGKDWSLLKSLAGHEAKVMDVDISRDGESIVSSSFDRTWKLWRPTSKLDLNFDNDDNNSNSRSTNDNDMMLQ
eukprot:TRINITY_DN5120_c0_g1_i1.p1 TRINITY_DN5120_c0_g1~~TRINITY_DN5120_c0_g1_i1.p1  ORF type:complete len:532 (+),score=123.89 TRINITY_DN5120_c0_g1_i1:167-1762(+)